MCSAGKRRPDPTQQPSKVLRVRGPDKPSPLGMKQKLRKPFRIGLRSFQLGGIGSKRLVVDLMVRTDRDSWPYVIRHLLVRFVNGMRTILATNTIVLNALEHRAGITTFHILVHTAPWAVDATVVRGNLVTIIIPEDQIPDGRDQTHGNPLLGSVDP